MLVNGCYNTTHTNDLGKTQTLACQKPAPGTQAVTCDPAPADSTKPLTHTEASVADFSGHTPFPAQCLGPRPPPIPGVVQRPHWFQQLMPQVKGGHSPRLTAAADPSTNINIPESSIIHVHIHLTHSLDKK